MDNWLQSEHALKLWAQHSATVNYLSLRNIVGDKRSTRWTACVIIWYTLAGDDDNKGEGSLWGRSDHVTAACSMHTVALKRCGLFGFASELFTSKCVRYAFGFSNSVFYQGCINGLLLATINTVFVKIVEHKIRASKVSKNWARALLGGSLKIRHLCMTPGCYRIQTTQ